MPVAPRNRRLPTSTQVEVTVWSNSTPALWGKYTATHDSLARLVTRCVTNPG